MKAVLSNAALPQNGVASIPFPIPKADYDNCIAILEAIGIGDVRKPDCKVEEVSEEYPILKRLEGTVVNVDELDYLVKRLESFDKRELAQFGAVAVSHNLHEIKNLINLTFCCQDIPIVQDFTDLEKVGRFCHMDRNGGVLLPEAENLDFKKEALKLLLNEDGKVTQYGVIYDKDFQMELLYDGRNFPSYLYEEGIIAMEADPVGNTAAEAKGTFFCLPMSELQLERTMARGGFDTGDAIQPRRIDSSLPEEITDLIDFTEENLHNLNALCSAAAGFDKNDMEKYRAAVQLTVPATATELKNLAQQLELFDFIPGIRTPEEYGRHMICESGHFEYDENLEGYYDFEKYGRERMEQEQGEFNHCGYVSYHGVVSMEEVLAGMPGERLEQGMGGMDYV